MVPEPRILLALILFLSSAGKWFLVTILCVYTGGPGYGLHGQGIESRWGDIFRTLSSRLWGPPSLLYKGYRVIIGIKRPGRGANNPPHIALRLMKEYSYVYSYASLKDGDTF